VDQSENIRAVSDREWRGYVEPLLPIGERLVSLIKEPEDGQLRQEVYRAAFCALAAGYLTMLNSDADHPDFVPFTGQFLNLLGPNPDFMYYMAPVADDGSYLLSGYRGTVHMAIVQVAGGDFVPLGDGSNLGSTYNNYYLDDLTIGEDGAFEVILSGARPAGYTGDWWELAPGSTNIVVRQLSYDWLTEVDARIAIERLDRPAQRPRPTEEQIADRLSRLASWTESYVATSNRFCEAFAAKGLNEVHFIDFADDGGMPAQAYLEGMFDIGPDEALILETEIPERAHYWSFHLTDERWTTPDWLNRQSILNGHTATLDSDGNFRAVISPVDPGVPNWLDTLGYRRGIIQGRWHECSSYPRPKLTKVPIAQVRRYLPEDTPTITAEERDAAIRRLRKGAQMRRRW
jgi:hypothetical protein